MDLSHGCSSPSALAVPVLNPIAGCGRETQSGPSSGALRGWQVPRAATRSRSRARSWGCWLRSLCWDRYVPFTAWSWTAGCCPDSQGLYCGPEMGEIFFCISALLPTVGFQKDHIQDLTSCRVSA